MISLVTNSEKTYYFLLLFFSLELKPYTFWFRLTEPSRRARIAMGEETRQRNGGWNSSYCSLPATEPEKTLWPSIFIILFTIPPRCDFLQFWVRTLITLDSGDNRTSGLWLWKAVSSLLSLSPESILHLFHTVGYDVSPNMVSPWKPWVPSWPNFFISGDTCFNWTLLKSVPMWCLNHHTHFYTTIWKKVSQWQISYNIKHIVLKLNMFIHESFIPFVHFIEQFPN